MFGRPQASLCTVRPYLEHQGIGKHEGVAHVSLYPECVQEGSQEAGKDRPHQNGQCLGAEARLVGWEDC